MHTEASLLPLAQGRLLHMGWTLTKRSAIARKTFATAVGPKEAFVYLYEGASYETNMMIVGDYQSEGRNILCPESRLIPKDCDDEQAAKIIDDFAANAEKVIQASYAARLLRSA